ncbi:hypothetical protein B0H13DRAFT_2470652 [Mycena leptocephala]|nr:hypothetical protein B0H13DRAFT_2470652 [Mycena leptocephala]
MLPERRDWVYATRGYASQRSTAQVPPVSETFETRLPLAPHRSESASVPVPLPPVCRSSPATPPPHCPPLPRLLLLPSTQLRREVLVVLVRIASPLGTGVEPGRLTTPAPLHPAPASPASPRSPQARRPRTTCILTGCSSVGAAHKSRTPLPSHRGGYRSLVRGPVSASTTGKAFLLHTSIERLWSARGSRCTHD